jgi:pimeloyl-ACP methyl ester carboxylesterase/UDP-N-acetylglucosamine:LPS N-acetylglucosamine transferase
MTAAEAAVSGSARDQKRARYPDAEGYVERDGVRLFYEVYGEGGPTVLLLPTLSIVHSRHWKGQIPFLARHARVVVFDGRGNGRSDRPEGVAAYLESEFAADALAVMDATTTDRAALVAFSCGALWATLLAAEHPERVTRVAYIAPAVPLAPGHPDRKGNSFHDRLDTAEGWAKYNRHYWLEHYRDFLEFFAGRLFTEPHSSKQIEDCIGWGLETTPETLGDAAEAITLCRTESFREVCARVRCPVLVIHGDDDAVRPYAQGAALADVTGGALVTMEGSGHLPHARDPVGVNLLLEDFLGLRQPPARLVRGRERRRRALFISSPIGLGHVQRDLAIARELRRLEPRLEIEWLSQHPVTRVLEEAGEAVHPMSSRLASESAHWERSSSDHRLHCFQAWREMDEVLLANFMVFLEAARETPYDVWIGDEAWEVDYHLHENPELKTAPYVFLTDFVGWLPVAASNGSREAALCADYNAEMIEQVERYPHVRDRAIYVGELDDLVPEPLGAGLPSIPDWTREHFSAVGYVLPFDPTEYADTAAVRERLGYEADRPLVVCAVGGTGVGAGLLKKAVAAWPLIERERPDAQCVAICGPRIDPVTLPSQRALEVRAYVHDLYEHLAAADLAIVQGGLATTMELTACRRPFVYFPLADHCEQVLHVAHRLDRHRAGRRLEFAATDAEALAAAALETLGKDTSGYRLPAPGASARAAGLIAELL